MTGDSLLVTGYDGFEVIGRGGDSVVYRARQLDTGRIVAVKVLLADDASTVARFRRELEITVRLGQAHPHIVTVLDTGTTTEGNPFLVTGYHPLGSLHDALRRGGRLPAAQVVAAGVVLADALAYAHRQGVLHRDVKPQNVLVLPTSYVLADFGLARGTGFRHASPQVLDGQTPTVADDLWSLGSTLFTLLDGQPPFAADDAEQDTALAYRRRARTEPPRRLVRPDAPPGLITVIERCLARQRSDRPPDAATVRASLTALTVVADPDAEPTAPAPDFVGPLPETSDAATPQAPGHRGFAFAVIVVVIVSLAIGALTVWLHARRAGETDVLPTRPPATGVPVPTESFAPPTVVPTKGPPDPALAAEIIELRDNGSTVYLRWLDSTGGRAVFVVVGLAGTDTVVLRAFPAGTERAVVIHPDPLAARYCFAIVSIVDAGAFGISEPKCLSRPA